METAIEAFHRQIGVTRMEPVPESIPPPQVTEPAPTPTPTPLFPLEAFHQQIGVTRVMEPTLAPMPPVAKPVPEAVPDFTDKYNTALTPEQETKFQDWAKGRKNAAGGLVLNDLPAYDVRGRWLQLEAMSPEERAKTEVQGTHGPDTFKKPSHLTFSNESQYHGVEGHEGGVWGKDAEGNDTFTPGPANLQFHGAEDLQKYFTERETGVKLLPAEPPVPAPTLSPLEAFHQQIGVTRTEPGTKLLPEIAITPGTTPERLVRHFAGGVLGTAEGMGGAVQWITGGAMGKDFSDYMADLRRRVTPEGEAPFVEQLAAGAGSMATFFIPGFGVARGLGIAARVAPKAAGWLGAGTMAVTEAATEAGQVYRDELEKGKDAGIASNAASWTFWLNLPVLTVTDKLAFFGNQGKALARALRGMVMEGSQESLQEVISTWSQEEQQNLKNILTSGAIGAILGGGVGAIARPLGRPTEPIPPPPAPAPIPEAIAPKGVPREVPTPEIGAVTGEVKPILDQFGRPARPDEVQAALAKGPWERNALEKLLADQAQKEAREAIIPGVRPGGPIELAPGYRERAKTGEEVLDRLQRSVDIVGEPNAAKQLNDTLAANQGDLINAFRAPGGTRGIPEITNRIVELTYKLEDTGDPGVARQLSDFIESNLGALKGLPRWPSVGTKPLPAAIAPRPPMGVAGVETAVVKPSVTVAGPPVQPMGVAGGEAKDLATRGIPGVKVPPVMPIPPTATPAAAVPGTPGFAEYIETGVPGKVPAVAPAMAPTPTPTPTEIVQPGPPGEARPPITPGAELARQALAQSRNLAPESLEYIGDMEGLGGKPGLHLFNITDPTSPNYQSTVTWPIGEAIPPAATLPPTAGERIIPGERPSTTPGVSFHDEFPRDQFEMNPDVWQHKLAGGQALAHIKDRSQWDELAAREPSLYRYPDGRVELMDGHSRVVAGDRVGVTGYGSRIFDGNVYSVEEARTTAALINIRQGTGTVVDSAKAIRDFGFTIDDLRQNGIDLNSEHTSLALGLANLSDLIFTDVAKGDFPAKKGAIIGQELSGKPEGQDAIYKLILRKYKDKNGALSISDDRLRQTIRFAEFSQVVPTKETALPGFENLLEENLVNENADLMTYGMRLLADEKRLFKTVGVKSEQLIAAGNRLKPDVNKRISEEAATGLAILDKAAFLPDSETNRLFKEFALKLQESRLKSQVKEAFYERLPAALEADRNAVGLGQIPPGRLREEISAPTAPGEPRLPEAIAPERPRLTEPPTGITPRPKYRIESEEPLLSGSFDNRLEDVLREFAPADRKGIREDARIVLQSLSKEWPVTARQVAFLASDPALFDQVMKGNMAVLEQAKRATRVTPGVQRGLPGTELPQGRGGRTLFEAGPTKDNFSAKMQEKYGTEWWHSEATDAELREWVDLPGAAIFPQGERLTTKLIQERYGKYGTASELATESLPAGYARGWMVQEKSGQIALIFESKEGSLELGLGGINPEYAALGYKFKPEDIIAGSHTPIPVGSLIELAKDRGGRVFDHELWHGIEDRLTPKERAAIIRDFGDNEEIRARAYADWNPKEAPNTVFQKILDFFKRILKAITGKASGEDVFAMARRGELFVREPVERRLPEALAPRKFRVEEERQGWLAISEPLTFNQFKTQLAADNGVLWEALKAPGSRMIPLYEGERYLGTRAGNFIKDQKGNIVELSKKEVWERLYDPQKPRLPSGTETARPEDFLGKGELGEPEGTIEQPPGFFGSVLRDIREPWTAKNLSKLAGETHQEIIKNMGWGARQMEQAINILDKYNDVFGRMSQTDLLAFTDTVESTPLTELQGMAARGEFDPTLLEAAQSWRQLSDGVHALRAALTPEQETAYWNEYFPRLFQMPEQVDAVDLINLRLKARRPLTGPESFKKPRSQLLFSDSVKPRLATIRNADGTYSVEQTDIYDRTKSIVETFATEAEADTMVAEKGGLGLRPLDPNYINMMKANLYEQLRFLTGKYIEADLKEVGFLTKKKTTGWVKIEGDKTLQGYYAHPDVAKVLENFLSKGIGNNILFKLYNHPVSFMNHVLVGLSGFHATFSLFSSWALGIGANLTRAVGAAATGRFGITGHYLAELGKTFNIPAQFRLGGRGSVEYSVPGTYPELTELIDVLEKGGMRNQLIPFRKILQSFKEPSKADLTQMSRTFADALQEASGWPRKIVEAISWPTMGQIVPRLKLAGMLRYLQMELDTAKREGRTIEGPDLVRLAQDIAAKGDNIFGQMVMDNRSMKRSLRDMFRVFIGFPGWNIGSFTDILQAGKGIVHIIGQSGQVGADLFRGRKPSWEAMSRQERMSLELYLGITLTMAVFGVLAQRLLAGEWPEDGKDLMMPRTGALMANGQPERLRAPTYMRDVLNLGQPVEMLKHKLNFPLRIFAAMTDNQDFFGEQIRDPFAGKAEQAGQALKYLGRSLLPFGIQGYLATESAPARALNLIGITKVPRLYSNTAAMNIIDEYNKQNRATMSSKQQAGEKQLKKELRDFAKDMDEAGFQEAARKAMAEGNLTRQQIKTIVDESQAPPGLSRFVALPVEWMVRAWQKATPQEQEIWQPYFLKKLATATPEILIRNRAVLVPVLRGMGFDEIADTIEGLEISEKAAKFELSRLGVRKPSPEIGDIGTVDIALAKAIQRTAEKEGTEKRGVGALKKPGKFAYLGF